MTGPTAARGRPGDAAPAMADAPRPTPLHLATARKTLTIPCEDPATSDSLGEVPGDDEASIRSKVSRGRELQARWGATSFEERRAVLGALLERIVARQGEICERAARDSGKTRVDAAMGEVFPVCEKIRYTLKFGERDLAPSRRRSGFLAHKRAWVEYRPFGVVGIICPWNFPFHNIYCPLVPALFAGNAVVLKVSEHVAWSAQAYVDLVREVLAQRGHDPDLVQLVQGYGEAGRALIEAPVDKVFFTGSPENGRKVMAAASAAPTPVVLELGGKDPMIVCEDADLQRVQDAVMLGVFTACGQMCVGAERVFVHDAVHDAFVDRMEAIVGKLRQGPPLGASTVDCGATTMPRQVDIIESLVDDAIARGARVVVGGKRGAQGSGNYFEPTILVGVTPDMRIAREECFGPVLTIIAWSDDDEVVKMANDCEFGLGSSVFSADQARARSIARRLRAGMSVINDYGIAYMVQSMPFGGVGISGFGRMNGREGLRACCYTHAFAEDRLPIGKSVGIHPISAATYPLVEGAVSFIYGRGARVRGEGLRAVASSLWSMARERR